MRKKVVRKKKRTMARTLPARSGWFETKEKPVVAIIALMVVLAIVAIAYGHRPGIKTDDFQFDADLNRSNQPNKIDHSNTKSN